jgi:predicted PurR-regulated permease PerM
MWRAEVRSGAVLVLAVVAVVLALRHAHELLIPIALGILVSYALSPIVTRLVVWRVPRILAVAVVLLTLVGALAAGGYALRHQVTAVVDRLPEAARDLRQRLGVQREEPGALDKVQEAAEELARVGEAAERRRPRVTPGGALRVQPEERAFDLRAYLVSASVTLGFLAVQATMVLFLVFFLLASGDLYKRKLVSVFGADPARRRLTVEILEDIGVQIGRFLLVRAATNALVAVVTGLALWALGLEQPAVWGLLAGVFNTIPYFGPFLVTVGLAVVSFLQFGTLSMALGVAIVALAITSLEGWLLAPALLGRAARMNAVAIFVSLLFWSWMWGVLGLILAVPIMAAVKSVADHVEPLQPLRELLAE